MLNTTYLPLNQNWKFNLGEETNAWYAGFDDTQWQDVMLPHDWSVLNPFDQTYSSGTGYLCGGIGWYRIHFHLGEEYRGKKVRVLFDGIYKNSQIWCNSYHLGKHPSGYITVTHDITDFLHFGDEENVISVKVDHRDISDSRWFTGSGITRSASLCIQEPIHADLYGVFFYTCHADSESSEYRIRHTIKNEADKDAVIKVRTTLYEASGEIVQEIIEKDEINCNETKDIEVSGVITNPKLWSMDSPYLYYFTSEISVDGSEFYEIEKARVGIRDIRFDADHGLFLNGENLKMKGVCVHHDGGALGAAMTEEIWRRRLWKLKELGCNAIRMSHNPQMKELYDLCDEMGFLAIEEAFDEWENPKNKWWCGHNVYPPKHEGYAHDFPQWHKEDLIRIVRRTRNHPSVIMWSIGNEIDYPNDPYCHPYFNEMTGNNDSNKPSAEKIYDPKKPNAIRLASIADSLSKIVKGEDPTRPVTVAAAFPELSANLGFFKEIDVVGYNYKEHLYEQDHKKLLGKPLFGSENNHDYKGWKAVRDMEFISGQYLWTGFDYLGEAHGWPIHGSDAGLLTTAGDRKVEFYKRKSYWAEKPVIYMVTCRAEEEYGEWMPFQRSWNYNNGEKVLLRVYTNLDEVTVHLNNKVYTSIDRKQITSDSCMLKPFEEYGCLEFQMTYEPGVLTAEAVNHGEAAICDRLCTDEVHKGMHQLQLNIWDENNMAEETVSDTYILAKPLHYVYQVILQMIDNEGLRVRNRDEEIYVTVDGGGTLLSIDNGDLADNTSYTESFRKTKNGYLIIYVRKINDDNIRIQVQGKELTERHFELITKQ